MGVLEILAAGKGDDKLELGDDGKANGEKVNELLTKKYSIFIAVGEGEAKKDMKVTSFDSEKNEFVVEETVNEKKETRIAAKDAKATAIAPVAGG
jgi:hypothetical protein